MSKKDFIALAECVKSITSDLRHAAQRDQSGSVDVEEAVEVVTINLARFCSAQNSHFMRQRWLDYIKGECGPSGGAR